MRLRNDVVLIHELLAVRYYLEVGVQAHDSEVQLQGVEELVKRQVILLEVEGLELLDEDVLRYIDDRHELDDQVVQEGDVDQEAEETADRRPIRVPSLMKEHMIVLSHGTVTEEPLCLLETLVPFGLADQRGTTLDPFLIFHLLLWLFFLLMKGELLVCWSIYMLRFSVVALWIVHIVFIM